MEDQGRTEVLLGLILTQLMNAPATKDASQKDKIAKLRFAGFSNVEIADLLGTTAATVAQTVHAAKGVKRSRARPKK